MSLPQVWTLQDGTQIAHYGLIDQWGWYSQEGELLDNLTRSEAEHKIESQHGEVQRCE